MELDLRLKKESNICKHMMNKYIIELKKRNFFLHYGDVTDAISVSSLIKKIRPDEIYNLAAQSGGPHGLPVRIPQI